MTISNGYVNFTNELTTFGESIPVNCLTGYALSGGNSIECLANGEWRTTVTCERKGKVLYKGPGYNITIHNCFASFLELE